MIHDTAQPLVRNLAGSIFGNIQEKTFAPESGSLEGYTYTRNDAVTTYFDENGEIQLAAANTEIPFHGLPYGGSAQTGLFHRPARTNKCSNYNANPTTNAGFTVTSGTADVTVEDGSAKLASSAYGLDNVCTSGNVIQITNTGAGTAIVTVDEQVGNLNAHGLFAFIQCTTTGYHGTFKLLGGSPQLNMQNDDTEFHPYKISNSIPTATSRKISFNVATGKSIRVVLWHLEETSCDDIVPIVCAGSAPTTARDLYHRDDMATQPWFNEHEGTLTMRVIPFDLSGDAAQRLFSISAGTGFTEFMGHVMLATRAQVAADVRGNNTDYQTADIHRPIVNREFPIAMLWSNGSNNAIAGTSYEEVAVANNPSGLTEMVIGGRKFTDAFRGVILSLSIKTVRQNMYDLHNELFPDAVKAVMISGQSNGLSVFDAHTEKLNGGETAAVAEADVTWTDTENWMGNGCLGGSKLIYSSGTNWWYNLSTGEFGPRMVQWEQVARTIGIGNIKWIVWDQGESDTNESAADYKTAFLACKAKWYEILGKTVPIIIVPLGRREDGKSASGYQTIRIDAQYALADENADIYLAPDKFPYSLSDGVVHVSDAGLAELYPAVIRKGMDASGETVSGGVDPATLASVSGSGTAWTVALTHGAGTDFTPTTGIEGFDAFDDVGAIAITAAVRGSATTIDFTLATTPTGNITFRYGYGILDGVTYTNLVRDNSTHQLSLRAGTVTTSV